MNASLPRALLLVSLATLIAFGGASTAYAGTKSKSGATKLKMPKWDTKKILPKVKFKAGGKLSKTQAKIHMTALVTFAGKTHRISVFNMGIKKSKKAVRVERKIGKLRVALKISWSGGRTIIVKGTARYMKFKVPIPRIKIRV